MDSELVLNKDIKVDFGYYGGIKYSLHIIHLPLCMDRSVGPCSIDFYYSTKQQSMVIMFYTILHLSIVYEHTGCYPYWDFAVIDY